MSSKSAGPVKTHQEKLIDKAKKAIEEFWPPESNTNSDSLKNTENQSVEASTNQATKITESTQVQTISNEQENDVSLNEIKYKPTKAKEQNHPINKKSKR
jgi:DNA topoisomerase IA